MALTGGGGKGFKQFDVVSGHSDHHYAANSTTSFSNVVQKKIMHEWQILKRSLPDSIYVRVYEDRIDLLRAVIVGAAGTPYHDGLFFFDIAFPPDYPTRPPFVYYRSYGLRLNPNLYANGVVCLSLLNTWFGRKSEKWNPEESTVLQVLVSIQALVLNERPFFNEPGTGWFPGLNRVSTQYSGEVFALSCTTMLHVLRTVPDHFGPFVRAHFRQRSAAILTAISEYANDRVRVGYYGDDGSSTSGSRASKIEVTKKVKDSMKTLYPALIREFRALGASVGSFGQHLEIKVKKVRPEPAKEGGVKVKAVRPEPAKEGGIIGFVIGKVKGIFGLK